MSNRDFTGQDSPTGQPYQSGGTDWSSTGTSHPTAESGTDKAKHAVSTAQHKADEMAHQASQKADEGLDKAAIGLDKASDALRSRGESMGEGTVGQAATMAADRLEQGAQMLREKDTDQLVADLEDLIRRRPMESLLVAAGVGFLLSKAMR
jgi:hypothetical protein